MSPERGAGASEGFPPENLQFETSFSCLLLGLRPPINSVSCGFIRLLEMSSIAPLTNCSACRFTPVHRRARPETKPFVVPSSKANFERFLQVYQFFLHRQRHGELFTARTYERHREHRAFIVKRFQRLQFLPLCMGATKVFSISNGTASFFVHTVDDRSTGMFGKNMVCGFPRVHVPSQQLGLHERYCRRQGRHRPRPHWRHPHPLHAEVSGKLCAQLRCHTRGRASSEAARPERHTPSATGTGTLSSPSKHDHRHIDHCSSAPTQDGHVNSLLQSFT